MRKTRKEKISIGDLVWITHGSSPREGVDKICGITVGVSDTAPHDVWYRVLHTKSGKNYLDFFPEVMVYKI